MLTSILAEIGVQGKGGGKWLTHKGKDKWFPQWTDPTIQKIMQGTEVAVYPTIMNKVIGKQLPEAFSSNPKVIIYENFEEAASQLHAKGIITSFQVEKIAQEF